MLVPLRKAVSSNGQPGGEYSVDSAHSSSDATTALRALSVTRPLLTVFVFVGVGEEASICVVVGVGVGVGVGEEASICVVVGIGFASFPDLDEKRLLPELNPLLI